MKEKKNFMCKGSTVKMKFSNMKVLKLSTEKKGPTAANMQAKVSPAYYFESNGVGEALSEFNNFTDVESDTHRFKASPTHMMGLGIAKAPIKEAILPTYAALEKNAIIADKHCIVCLKNNLTLKALKSHLLDIHGVAIEDPISEWLGAERDW